MKTRQTDAFLHRQSMNQPFVNVPQKRPPGLQFY